jgi:hypothetical protein
MGGYTKHYYSKECLYHPDKYHKELWIGSVFITYTTEKNDWILSSKYMLYLNNMITITSHQVFPWYSEIRIYREEN